MKSATIEDPFEPDFWKGLGSFADSSFLARAEKLHHFYWRTVIPLNLIRLRQPGELVRRHLWDSVAPFFLTPEKLGQKRIIDVGSGPGLPLFPILVLREGISGFIIERRGSLEGLYRIFQREFRGLDFDFTCCSVAQAHLPDPFRVAGGLLVSRAVNRCLDLIRDLERAHFPPLSVFFYKGEERLALEPEFLSRYQPRIWSLPLPEGRVGGYAIIDFSVPGDR